MATKTKEPTKAAIGRLHAAYLEAAIDPDTGIARVLRALAKRFGIPFAEADRAATLGHWEMERRNERAMRWHRQYGGGAKTEADFVGFYVREHYAHLTAAGPEGERLATAHARDIWVRAMGPALEWRAAVELDEAREAYDAIEEVRRTLNTKRHTAERERRAA